MRFKTTAIAAACIALAPAAFAAGTNKSDANGGHMATGAHSSMSSEQTRQIQQALSDRGFDPGPVDGVMGPKTRQALRNFRQAQGMSGGNSMDSATLSALGVDATSSSTNTGAMNRGSAMPGDASHSASGTGAGGTTGSRAGTVGTTGSETPPTTSTGSSSTPTTPGGSQMPSTSSGPMGSSSMGGTPPATTGNTRNPSASPTDNRATGTDTYGTSGGQKR